MSSIGYGLRGFSAGFERGTQRRQRDHALDLQEKRQTAADTAAQRSATRQDRQDAAKERRAALKDQRDTATFNQGQQDREAKLYDLSIERLHQGVRLINAGGDAAQVSAQIGQGLPKEFQPNITVIDVQQGVDKNGQPVSENVYSIEFDGKPIGGGKGFTSDAIFRGSLDPTVALDQFSAGAKIDAGIPGKVAEAGAAELGVRTGQAAEDQSALGIRAETGAVAQEQELAGAQRGLGIQQAQDKAADLPAAAIERGAQRTRAAAGETRAQEKHTVDIATARAKAERGGLSSEASTKRMDSIRDDIIKAEGTGRFANASASREELYSLMSDSQLRNELTSLQRQIKETEGLVSRGKQVEGLRRNSYEEGAFPEDEALTDRAGLADRQRYLRDHVTSIQSFFGEADESLGVRIAAEPDPTSLPPEVRRPAAPAQQGVGGIRPQAVAPALEVTPGKTASQVTDGMIQNAARRFSGSTQAESQGIKTDKEVEDRLRVLREKMGDEKWLKKYGALTN